MLLPLRTDSPLRHTPWMNWGLIVANVVVFFAQQMKPPWMNYKLHLDPAHASLHSFITYAFLHANTAHLVSNLLFFIGSMEIPCFWFIGLFFVQDLIFNAGGADHVAHAAHIAGTIFGFVVCFAMLFANLVPRDQFDIVALVQRWNRRRQYRDVV